MKDIKHRRELIIAACLAACFLAGMVRLHAISSPPYTGNDPDIHVNFELVNGYITDAFCSPFPYHLGSLKVGTSKTVTFKIWNLGNGTASLKLLGPTGTPVEITKDDSSGKFSITAQPISINLAPSPTFYLQFQLTLNAPTGTTAKVYSCTIRILNDDPDESEYLIPVTMRVTSGDDPELILLQGSSFIPHGAGTDASRGSFDFGGRRASNGLTKSFTIENAGTGALIVTGATRDGSPTFTFAPAPSGTINAGQVGTFGISYQSSSAEHASGTINIESNDSDYPTPSFMVNGTTTTGYQEEINLMQGCRWIPFDTQYSAANIDFGNVNVKDPQKGLAGFLRYIVDVKNIGMATLTVSASSMSDVTGSGAIAFGITGISSTTTISAGQSHPVIVTFEPPYRGTFSAIITIHSTYSDSSVHDCIFTVSGNGTDTIAPASPKGLRQQ